MRIALIAPSYALRLGLRALIAEGIEMVGSIPALEIIQEAATLEQLDDSIEQIELLLIAGDATSSPALVKAARSRPEGISLLLLSDDPHAARQLQRLGLRAWGVLPSDCHPVEFYSALLAVYAGLLVGKPELLFPPLTNDLEMDEGGFAPVESLTERENQVLQALARGLANKQIALQLAISEHTVKFHVSSIYAKLGVTSRTEAVRAGVQQGLVTL